MNYRTARLNGHVFINDFKRSEKNMIIYNPFYASFGKLSPLFVVNIVFVDKISQKIDTVKTGAVSVKNLFIYLIKEF